MDRRHLIASGITSFVTHYATAQERDIRSVGKLVWCNREGAEAGFALELSEAIRREDVFLIEILPKKYSVDVNEVPLKIARSLTIRGLGIGAEISVDHKSTHSNTALMDISSSNFCISNIKISFFNSKKNSVIFKFSKNISNIRFDNVKIVGEELSDSANNRSFERPHGIYLDDAASVVDAIFDKVTFKGLGYGLLSSNNYHGRADRWLFSECVFYENYLDDLEFNSSDNNQQPWSNIRIINSEFYGRNRQYEKYSGFAIGMDSVKDVMISGNKFYGYLREVLHVEDYISNVIINSNIFEDVKIGIMIYEKSSTNVMVSDNIVRGSFLVSEGGSESVPLPDKSTIGIYVANPGVLTSSSNVRIHNNIVERFHFGIYAPVDRLGVVSNNTISQCLVGAYIPKSRFPRIVNNTIGNCVYGVSGSAVVVGKNTFENCRSIVSPISSGVRFVEGLLIKNHRPIKLNGEEYIFGLRGIATKPIQGLFMAFIDALQIELICDVANNEVSPYGFRGNSPSIRFYKADAPFVGVVVDFSQLKNFSIDSVESSFYFNSGVVLA